MNLLIEKFKIDENILFLPSTFWRKLKIPENFFSERKNFISISNFFFHEPNWQTVLQLKNFGKTLKTTSKSRNSYLWFAYASEKSLSIA